MLWEFSSGDWIASLWYAATLSFLCGYLADRILGYSSFGLIGNTLVLLAGAYAGLLVFNALGYRLEWDPAITFGTAFGSATALFVMLCGAKALTHT